MSDHFPIELTPPDITPYRAGNTGVEYATRIDSGRSGPNVLVQALTHGNELCGAIALDWLMREGLRPTQGSLTLVFANVAAFERFDIDDPDRSRFVDEDLNRVWADAMLDGPGDSVELRRARALRPIVDAADYLLDIHSMHEPCRPIMVCGTSEKSAAFARRIGVPADLLIDTGHPSGLRMIERGAFGDASSPRSAVLLECGQHWEKAAADVAIDALVRFLALTGVVDTAWARERQRVAPPERQRLVRVTEPVVAETMNFSLERRYAGLEVIPRVGTPIAHDGDRVWRTPYDDCVMVMPSMVHLKPGRTMVRLGRYDPQ
jgi:predicted deacylase